MAKERTPILTAASHNRGVRVACSSFNGSQAFWFPFPSGKGAGVRSPEISRFSPGFTLLEIAVVLFLMGLMMLIAMPYFGGYRGAQMKSEARRLAGRATYLFDEASSKKLVIRLIFDLDRNGYTVMVADPYSLQPTFSPDRSSAGAPVILPPTVRIRDVTVEGVGTYSRGAVTCQFYPEGYVDATLVHLINASGDTMTLGIDPLTGRVLIAAGDLSQSQLVQMVSR